MDRGRKDIIPEEKESVQEKRQLVELVTEGQLERFVNEVFSPKERENEELYSKQTVSTADVYEIVKQHTVFLGSKTAQSFATWCRDKNVDLMNTKEKKGKTRSRDLYILDERYYEDLVTSIISYLPRYQDTLKLLTLNRMELVGYARKIDWLKASPTVRLIIIGVTRVHECHLTNIQPQYRPENNNSGLNETRAMHICTT